MICVFGAAYRRHVVIKWLLLVRLRRQITCPHPCAPRGRSTVLALGCRLRRARRDRLVTLRTVPRLRPHRLTSQTSVAPNWRHSYTANHGVFCVSVGGHHDVERVSLSADRAYVTCSHKRCKRGPSSVVHCVVRFVPTPRFAVRPPLSPQARCSFLLSPAGVICAGRFTGDDHACQFHAPVLSALQQAYR